MTTIQYLIVVEGTAPDADSGRVEQILRKIWPDAARTVADLPLELPRRFDLRGASEWIEALTRAGLRARVEVEGTATAAEPGGSEVVSVDNDALSLGGQIPASPWALWAALLRDPEPLLTTMPSTAPGRAILFGWLAGAVGGTLALPAELWLLRQFDPEIGLASGASLLGAMLLVEPLLRLAAWTLSLRLLLGIGGVAAGWRETGALVGLAQAWQPLRAIPVLGAVLATFGALWYTGTGIGARFALSPRRLVGLLLLPLVLAAVAAAGFGLLVATTLTRLPDLIPALGRWPF